MKQILLSIILISFSSCAFIEQRSEKLFGGQTKSVGKRLSVNIDAIAISGTPAKSKIFVESKTGASHLEGVLFQDEFKISIEQYGYQIVNDITEADYIVNFNYEGTRQKRIETNPVYNWSSPKSFNVYGSGGGIATVRETGVGQLQYAGSTTTETIINHNYLNVICFEKSKYKAIIMKGRTDIDKASIWQVQAHAVSNSSDLKYVIPIMMNAVASNFETMKTQRFSQDAFDNFKD
jgi:hypothetical protein